MREVAEQQHKMSDLSNPYPTDENDAVHAIKVVTIAVKASKFFQIHIFELFKS